MLNLNHVVLAGNLTRDPELRALANGNAVGKLSIAVNRRYTTAGGEQREDTVFVDVDVWGRTAENCARYLAKGAPVYVEGRLKLDEWQDRDSGAKRSRLGVTAESVQFLGRPSADNAPPVTPPQQGGWQGVPRGNPPPMPASAEARFAEDDDPGPGPQDDIPF